jgi:hypothetical protein
MRDPGDDAVKVIRVALRFYQSFVSVALRAAVEVLLGRRMAGEASPVTRRLYRRGRQFAIAPSKSSSSLSYGEALSTTRADLKFASKNGEASLGDHTPMRHMRAEGIAFEDHRSPRSSSRESLPRCGSPLIDNAAAVGRRRTGPGRIAAA